MNQFSVHLIADLFEGFYPIGAKEYTVFEQTSSYEREEVEGTLFLSASELAVLVRPSGKVAKAVNLMNETKRLFAPCADLDDITLSEAIQAAQWLRQRFFAVENAADEPASIFFSGRGFHIIFESLATGSEYERWINVCRQCKLVDKQWLRHQEDQGSLWLRVSGKPLNEVPPVLVWRDDGTDVWQEEVSKKDLDDDAPF